MGRALSLSLAVHAAFMISFLLLSATRQPLRLPPIARQVRLVTYLEPAAAPRARTATTAVPVPPRAAPPPVAPRVSAPPAVEIPATAAESPQMPRIVIPVPSRRQASARTPPATKTSPTLSERLARRLAPSESGKNPPENVPLLKNASLPRPEQVTHADNAAQNVAETPAPSPGAVMPVGYFPHAWYLGVLKEKVYSRWSPPSELFTTSRTPTALVALRIDRAGRIGAITLKEGSGSARFDQSALAAVRSLGQVPPLPEQYPEESLDVVIRFQNQP